MAYSRWVAWVLPMCLALVGGCETQVPRDALALSPDTLEERTIQSRYYETKDEAEILAACAGVLQDLGFTIDEAETELGFMVGSKDRDATDAEQVAGAIVMAVLLGVSMPIDKNQKLKAAIVVNPSLDGNGMHVRVKFQRKVWDTQNRVSRVETIEDPELYQRFFERLSKSVFLEGHKI